MKCFIAKKTFAKIIFFTEEKNVCQKKISLKTNFTEKNFHLRKFLLKKIFTEENFRIKIFSEEKNYQIFFLVGLAEICHAGSTHKNNIIQGGLGLGGIG